ncbi:glycosyltransferase [Acinetobacter sp. 256-1]|uniref:glycosyltransferase family 2 protein n=1 Tax=Acinetobacter sp. 256-1 TaxID=2746721 RepID=UPI002575FED7|nr:glycosyltransferase [Acinetobacter sp. 256-1]MDM1759119.1 glycosyltransferase [Acinetobacter sp. 256-1]
MIKLSIVIPIYKVENYIIECLESVCCQLVEGVEVILVNDGTPDNSMLMARQYISEQYAHLKEQFIFIDQENQGLSGARNTGIKFAKGEYIMFLDSDDLIEKEFFLKIFNVLKDRDIDIVQYKAYRFRGNQHHKIDFMVDSPFVEKEYLLDEKVLKFVFNSSNWFAWLRVYKKDLFKNISFPLRKLYEDAYTIPFIFLRAKNIFFINECLVGYRYNDQGITAKITPKSIDDLKSVSELFLKSISQHTFFNLSFISVSQYYITQSLQAEGGRKAHTRWCELKNKIDKNNFDSKIIVNRGNKLFYKFGVFFLYFNALLLKIRIKR